MALPVLRVSSLGELQAALAADVPRSILLLAIDAVGDAPLCLAAIEEKKVAGWICINVVEVDRAARFANYLAKLADEIFPRLIQDRHDRDTLRSLRACGRAIMRVRQSSGSGNVFDLAGRFSNCLVRIARQALSTSKREPYTVTLDWILGKVRAVEETRASPILFLTAPAPLALAPQPQLPVCFITTLDDILAMDHLVPAGRHEIRLVSINALRDAPVFFSAIEQKVSVGWICSDLPHLDKAKRFAERLVCLDDDILPMLLHHAEDRTTLRKMRACGQAIWKIRRHSGGVLFDVMGCYTNCLTRAARQALNKKKPYTVAPDWVHAMMDLVDKDLASTIEF